MSTLALVTRAASTASRYGTISDFDNSDGTEDVYQTVSSRVSALQAQLSQTELDNKQKLAAREAQYQLQVDEAEKKNSQMHKDNIQMAEDVENLRTSNADLRNKAIALKAEIGKWTDDWRAMQGNISTALEVSNSTLELLHRESHAPTTQVLFDLRKKEERERLQTEHQKKLDNIAHSRLGLSLLQSSSSQIPGESGGSPQSLLRVLDVGLEDLATENAQREKELKAKYSAIMAEVMHKREALQKDADALTKQKNQLLAIQDRLRIAVKFLEDTKSRLEVQGRSLRMYAQRIGIRPIPKHATWPPVTSADTINMDTEDEATEPKMYMRSPGVSAASTSTEEDQSYDGEGMYVRTPGVSTASTSTEEDQSYEGEEDNKLS